MITFKFEEGAQTKPFEQLSASEMDKPLKFFEQELLKIRAGRAHTSMIENIKVNSYGTMMPLKQLAALSAPDVNMLMIQPWDKSIIGEIEKAISTSELGLTPINDGNVIRITLQRLSSERRDELIKTLSKRLEEAKVNVRNVRKDFHNLIREAEKNKKISEDYSKRLQDVVQKITDKAIESLDKVAQKKEADIRGA